ncbi:MAG TPA: hypothetical protein VFH62_03765 [Dehalococcoidia bacterium]|jgi:hypothetical protein|nr:hypothetical protein [Dehalococcoidia bacterium]
MLEINPNTLGTIEIDGRWVPYLNLYELESIPTRLKIANDEYAFTRSAPVRGHGAVLPDEIREARNAGKRSVIVEREDRYYVFVTPP